MFKINFDVQRNVLNNGLEVITIKKDTKIASINVGVKVGSLYENDSERGISHFIEHMIFKGTKKRNYQQINDELEFLGGEYNAYTDYSSTVYTVSSLEEELINAIEVLGDMVTESVFSHKEIEKERGVILSEIRSSRDDIEDYSFSKVSEIAYNKSPLRFDVAGTEERVKGFSREDLIGFYNKFYVPNNTIITIVSSLEHNEVLEEVDKYFGKWKNGIVGQRIIPVEDNISTTITSYKDNIEQSTIIYMYTFHNLSKELELPLRILNHRLGESSNSLLFREVRENKGLAYDIYSNIDMATNVKTMCIYTAVNSEDVEETINAIDETIEDVVNGNVAMGIRDLELMKKVHKTAVISTLEDSTELCNYILNQALENDDLYEFAADMEKLNSLNINKIHEVAQIVLKNPTIHILKSS